MAEEKGQATTRYDPVTGGSEKSASGDPIVDITMPDGSQAEATTRYDPVTGGSEKSASGDPIVDITPKN